MNHRPHEISLRLITPLLGILVLLSWSGRLDCQDAAKVSGRPNPIASEACEGSLDTNRLVQNLIQHMDQSGAMLTNEETPSERLTRSSEIPPGPAPFLSFRTFEQDGHYRLGKLDLVVDDAGH